MTMNDRTLTAAGIRAIQKTDTPSFSVLLAQSITDGTSLRLNVAFTSRAQCQRALCLQWVAVCWPLLLLAPHSWPTPCPSQWAKERQRTPRAPRSCPRCFGCARVSWAAQGTRPYSGPFAASTSSSPSWTAAAAPTRAFLAPSGPYCQPGFHYCYWYSYSSWWHCPSFPSRWERAAACPARGYHSMLARCEVTLYAAAGWRGNIDEMLAVCNTVAFIIIRLSTIFRLSQMAEESAGFRNMIYYTGWYSSAAYKDNSYTQSSYSLNFKYLYTFLVVHFRNCWYKNQ